MNRILSTLVYFVGCGLTYGLLLGAWSTTLMFPLIGTLFGLLYGTGIGTFCGLICGVLTAVIQMFTFHPDINLEAYRRRLSFGLGLLVAVTAPLMLIVSSQEILWGPPLAGRSVFAIPSLVAVIFWGGLSAAYVAHGYPTFLIGIITGKEDVPEWSLFVILSALLNRRFWRDTVIVGGVIGLVAGTFLTLRDVYVRYPSVIMMIPNGLGGLGLGVFVAILLTVVLGFGVSVLMAFLNRLLFSAEGVKISSEFQRRVLSTAAALFTGGLCVGLFALNGLSREALLTVCVSGAVALLFGFHTYQAFSLQGKDKRKEKAEKKAKSAQGG